MKVKGKAMRKAPNGKRKAGKDAPTMAYKMKTPPPVIHEAMLSILRREIAKPGAQKQHVVKGICAPGTLTKWMAGSTMSLRHVEKILKKYGGGMTAELLVKVVDLFKDKVSILKDLVKVEESNDETAIENVEHTIHSWAGRIKT